MYILIGLNEYLNQYKYKSIETDNLFNILVKYDTHLIPKLQIL